ncbi:hypothetical protein BLA29_013472, partial [Euroglyphus maynei]
QTADYVRSYSSWQFDRTFTHINNDQCPSSLAVIIDNDNELIDPIKHKLQRRFLHPNRNKLKDESIRVKTTLLEYGVIGTGADERIFSQSDLSNNDTTNDSTMTRPRSESESNDLLESMTKTDENKIGNSSKVSTSIVVKIVGEQSDEIRR